MTSCVEIGHSWWQWHPPVGWCVAIVGVLGVLVPWLRGEGMKRKERAVWTLVMIGLTLTELWSIRLDGRERDSEQAFAQCKQQQSFEEVISGLTGGDSYLFISLAPPFPANAYEPGEVGLMAMANGNYTLWDVHVDWEETPDPLDYWKAGKPPQSINLGTVSHTYAFPIGLIIHPDPTKETAYWFWAYSRSLPTLEVYKIRFNHSLQHWECSWTVWRLLDKPKVERKMLSNSDWVEMAPILPKPPD